MSETNSSDHKLEIAATILLALAAISTAWATYQSAVWRGEQAKAQSASIATRVESTRQAAVANRQVQIDVSLFTQWVDATARGEDELAAFYRKRFREEFVPAFDAWIATKPLESGDAPLSPFAMPEYRLAAQVEAEQLEEEAAAYGHAVARNIERADDYMLAVVLFAIALFFAALSIRLRSRDVRIALIGLGYVAFMGTVVWLATQPVSLSV
ncbi:MAG TPA: hypothetical protein VFU99_10670 [Gaiellaceae bacterium]|nr:hypothetical protein [Gaiellaceae bacterium]